MQAGLKRLFGGASSACRAPRRLRIGLLAAAALALAVPGMAKATPITIVPTPLAPYSNHVSGIIVNDLSSSQGDATGNPTSGLSVFGSGNGMSGPTFFSASTSNDYNIPRVSAAASAGAGASASADSGLAYFVAFSGADGIIPVNIQATGGATGTGTAQLTIDAVGGASVLAETATGGQLFSINQTYMLTTNALYRVIMTTFAVTNGGSSTAYVDPFFSVPAGYTVLTSAGIGNSALAATPIPAALPLFASGLGAMGVIGWRRKKTAARAA